MGSGEALAGLHWAKCLKKSAWKGPGGRRLANLAVHFTAPLACIAASEKCTLSEGTGLMAIKYHLFACALYVSASNSLYRRMNVERAIRR